MAPHGSLAGLEEPFRRSGSLEAVPRTPRQPLLLALACLAGLALTGVLAYLVPVAHTSDTATLQGFTALNRPRVTPLLDRVAHFCNPGSYAAIGAALACVALVRRRPRVAALVVGLLGATGVTTEQLKPLLASPRYDEWLGSGQIAAASWPSGHATAAMTLALCGVLVAPARWRPTAGALGAAFAVAVSYAVLALGWHFPSDVLGNFLVAAGWTALGVAGTLYLAVAEPLGLVALEARHPSRTRAEVAAGASSALAPLALVGGLAGAAALLVLARPVEAGQFATDHTTSVAGAVGIAALAATLALGLARGVRAG